MDLVKCVGFEKSKLTPDQVAKISAFVEAHPNGDLLQLRVYPNLDVTSDEEIPNGMIATFAPSAKVDATSIPDNLFQLLAVSKIVETEGTPKLTDEFFESKLPVIATAVDQFSPTPLQLKNRHDVSGKELAAWAPELSGSGSFVNVCYELQDDHRTKNYYIAARASLPLMVQELKKKIAADAPTYMELATDADWSRRLQYAEYASKRNVFRAIANTAEACGVEVVRMDDQIKLADPNHAPPEMAVPEWEQRTHTILATVFEGKPAVQITYGVVPAEDCLMLHQNSFFVVSSPYDGITVFDVKDHGKIMAAGGIPADTGRKVAPEKLGASLAEVKSSRAQGITWEKKADAAKHVDLHPEAFKPVGADFKESMKRAGWNPENHTRVLVRVAAKIHNPQLRRK
jgi:hypothetical protein